MKNNEIAEKSREIDRLLSEIALKKELDSTALVEKE